MPGRKYETVEEWVHGVPKDNAKKRKSNSIGNKMTEGRRKSRNGLSKKDRENSKGAERANIDTGGVKKYKEIKGSYETI